MIKPLDAVLCSDAPAEIFGTPFKHEVDTVVVVNGEDMTITTIVEGEYFTDENNHPVARYEVRHIWKGAP